ncbi:MAG TPA: helix-turn-helix transcriptional regulator [Thermoanaerobaculia bacterium]|nr:helix-turn-helix transcriptional regulator [Thermoanaerobaculia bacterium]
MRREHLLARLARALAGKSQDRMADEIGVHPSLVAHFEQGNVVPSRDHLERLAAGAGLTLPETEEILGLYEAFRQSSQSRGRSAEGLLDALAEQVRAHAEAVYRRILTLPRPETPPSPADREKAAVLWARLADFPEEVRLDVVRVAEEYQSWALCERVCAESTLEAPRRIEQAAALARLAQEIADRARGPEPWRNRLKGYAAAHAANVLKAAGDQNAAAAAFESARRLWHSGADPAALLDPAPLLALDASAEW